MPNKSEKGKANATEADLDLEIISKTEITFEDTKSITGVDQELKLGVYIR